MKAQDLIAGFQAATHENITTGGVTYIAFTSEELCKFIEAVLKAHTVVEPDDEGWIKCNGQPDLPPETRVDVIISGNATEGQTVEFWKSGFGVNNWNCDPEYRIVAYRVVK